MSGKQSPVSLNLADDVLLAVSFGLKQVRAKEDCVDARA